MAAPHAPIIGLRQGDDAVCAFFTKEEALLHFGGTAGETGTHHAHRFAGEELAGWEFFDARGRQLAATINSEGQQLQDLGVASNEDHAERVRERVRRRSALARDRLQEQREAFESVDESPLTLANDDVDFEVFAWRLASVLRPDWSPSDPVLKPGHHGPDHSAGWWHNTFGH